MILRVGVDSGRRAILAAARELGAPIMVSANSLWESKTKRFAGWKAYEGYDTALDSGGFIAMLKYGGYRWTVRQYVELAKTMRPTWWAQMDFCCEPQIASNRAEVFSRIERTAAHLHECQSEAAAAGTGRPMPVLQGWEPRDYCEGPIYSSSFEWPALVGVGSVCRRPVGGPTGVMAVINAINAAAPEHVKLHLFGVKGTALKHLEQHYPNRVQSADSFAWNMAARWDCLHAGVPCDAEAKAKTLIAWYRRQTHRPEVYQQSLGL
jgi:hypothetical protein